MKKHLIAAAVAAAVAVPAAAQVSISGALDVGYGSKETAAGVTNGSVMGGVHTTSNITFRGSEDLGGGLKAGFVIVQEFNVATGEIDDRSSTPATSISISDNSPQFQTAYAELSGGFGSIKLGTIAHATRDAGGVYRFFANIGRLTAGFNSDDTRENSFEYVSPAFNGLRVSVGKTDAGKGTNNAPADGRMTSIGISGSIQKALFSVGKETAKTSAGVKTEWTSIGGQYNFGMLKAGLAHVKLEADGDDDRSVNILQVAIPLGGAFTAGIGYAAYKDEAVSGGKTNQTTLIGQYDLSKRTAVVGSYQLLKNKTAVVSGNTRGLGVKEIANDSTDGFSVGIVHKF
jgi:predicted porin